MSENIHGAYCYCNFHHDVHLANHNVIQGFFTIIHTSGQPDLTQKYQEYQLRIEEDRKAFHQVEIKKSLP
ncbi:MAG: hypothetical protein K6U80_18660 [Firmicutes bacterium]|nr:hypothetical protein [Bacillota bacterium]